LVKALLCKTFSAYKFSDLEDEPADELLRGWQALLLYKSHLAPSLDED